MCVLASTHYYESIQNMHISVKLYYVTSVNSVKSTDIPVLLLYDLSFGNFFLFNVLSYFLGTCSCKLQKYGY